MVSNPTRKRLSMSEEDIAIARKQLADPANRITLSDKAFDTLSEMIENPDPEATQKLKDFLNRPSRFDVV